MTTDTTPLPFLCRKTPASGSQGVVVTNHPLGSAAGHEMMALGGNAVDAAVAALLTLTVVEPMMVGIVGALMVEGVQKVTLAEPAADVTCTQTQAAHCTAIAIESVGYGD